MTTANKNIGLRTRRGYDTNIERGRGMTTAITIIGLGPGRWDDLTLAAQACFAQAAQEGTTVYFRTYIHPTVEPLRQAFPALRCESFDSYYEESDDWAALYRRIAQQVCDLAEQQPLLYAVPGHP